MSLSSSRMRNPPAPAPSPPPTPTPHVGPFVMSVEFPTPSADEPTYRVPYEEVPTLEQAVAWIRHPPFPPETLKKLKKGVLLTARVRAEWVMENGQHGEEIAAMGTVLQVGPKIALITRDGITVDGESVTSRSSGIGVAKTRKIRAWFSPDSTASSLLGACVGVPSQLLALASCAVVRTALADKYERSQADIETIEAWAYIETIEAWAYGEAPYDLIKKLMSADVNSACGYASPEGAAACIVRALSGAISVNWDLARSANLARFTRSPVWVSHAKIVREWIGLPEVVFAACTRKK